MKLLVRYLGVVLVNKELAPGEYVIGRSPKADIPLTQDFISREHGKVYFADGAWWYQDLRTQHPRFRKERVKITDTAMVELENDIDLLTEPFLYAEDTGEYDIQDLKSMVKKSLANRRFTFALGTTLVLLVVGGGLYLGYHLLNRPMDANALLAFARPMVVELERVPEAKAVADLKRYAGLKDEDFSDRYSFCSGFVIAPEVVLTASHCVHRQVFVDLSYDFTIKMHDGRRFTPKRVLGFDPNRDYLFLEVPGLDGYGRFELRDRYAVGQAVYTIGNVLGEGIAIREGILASTTTDPNLPEIEYLRFSAAASPGNSGGPLVDGNGRVLGIVFAANWAENYNVATAAAHLLAGKQRFVDDRSAKTVAINLADKGRMDRMSVFQALGIPFSREWFEVPEVLDAANELQVLVPVPSEMRQHAKGLIDAFEQKTTEAYAAMVRAAAAKEVREESWAAHLGPEVPVIVPIQAAAVSDLEYLRLPNGLLAPAAMGFDAPAYDFQYETYLAERRQGDSAVYHPQQLGAQLPEPKDRKEVPKLLGRYRGSPDDRIHLRMLGDASFVLAVVDWGKQGEEIDTTRQLKPQAVLDELSGKDGILADTGHSDLVRPKAQRDFTIARLEETTAASAKIQDGAGREWTQYSWKLFDEMTLWAFCQPLPQGSVCVVTAIEANNDEWLEVRRRNYIRFELTDLRFEPELWSTPALVDYVGRGHARTTETLGDIELTLPKGGPLTLQLKSLGVRYTLPSKEIPDMIRPHVGLRAAGGSPRWVGTGFDAYYGSRKMICSTGVELEGGSAAGILSSESDTVLISPAERKKLWRKLKRPGEEKPLPVFSLCAPLRLDPDSGRHRVANYPFFWQPWEVKATRD
jgi:hypothetical protein